MKTEDVKRVQALCREVTALCDKLTIANWDPSWCDGPTRPRAELRRRSIDLTHALSDMRRPYRNDQ